MRPSPPFPFTTPPTLSTTVTSFRPPIFGKIMRCTTEYGRACIPVHLPWRRLDKKVSKTKLPISTTMHSSSSALLETPLHSTFFFCQSLLRNSLLKHTGIHEEKSVLVLCLGAHE
ncbi:hypothetical protein Naga_101562g1 [Nannochloropsis gaditana]|uniref:Uncharacterized protein n=1 Tax=Nannochloropsis gaditana TaxID=72520 RepID=W7TRD3_9STRA|nr:hypothetical protein Naga_101562g1 [Nannochloropsis gaditana]